MADCPQLIKCPIWEKFQSDVKYVWIRTYCQGDKQDACARRELYNSGKEVPLDLLPNGTTL